MIYKLEAQVVVLLSFLPFVIGLISPLFSMNQMCKFYTFLSEGVADLKIDIKREFLSPPSIFTPLQRPRSSEVIPGKFLLPKDLYWHDPTGCSEITEEFVATKSRRMFPRRMLSVAYPSLCEFFTEACGVPKVPKTSNYVEMLMLLSTAALPSQAANHVSIFNAWLYSTSYFVA
jgi:hypothetical protein